jgi:hypothetical protein
MKTKTSLRTNSVNRSKTEQRVTAYCIAGRKLAIACMAAALVMIVRVPPLYAPQREKPEKLSIDGLTWNSTAQGFLVELSALFGIATAGEGAGFSLSTLVVIFDLDGNPIVVLGPQVDPVVSRDGTTGDGEHFVSLVPQFVPCGSCAEIDDQVLVTFVTEVLNPDGETIATASARGEFEIP